MPKKSRKLFWIAIPGKTKWPIKDDDGNVQIHKGSTGVSFAPHQSSKIWIRNTDGKQVHQNAYMWNSVIYNA